MIVHLSALHNSLAKSRCLHQRALDNVFIERLWHSVKYEDIYLKNYDSVLDLDLGLLAYFHFYNHDRPHQALAYRTPAEVHFAPSPVAPTF